MVFICELYTLQQPLNHSFRCCAERELIGFDEGEYTVCPSPFLLHA